ncbi:MAG: LacI family DNA-binding transcriptional regulator [Gammaproteobacteria bacterium]|nr:LacI family DNA-binding transcriptional regulator [Gammaproteobacteria bacterium]NNC97593.1 LacI family DNA-binding transcriptional regulator [Gammaproteobacteria bacterium]NNM14790.1 LacI family DNA-binding transcriptional regulator [Gammaproteobacteria bacterium]
MQKVTIQTVADRANVSIKTVSRVINKETGVRDTTRDKVRAAIQELGYEPSPAARALASNSSKLIGLIYDNPSAAYITFVQDGALKACYENGYNIVIHPCEFSTVGLTEELITMVQRSRLDGLLLTPPLTDNQELIEALLEKKIPIASIAPSKTSQEYSSVSCNDAEVVYDITNYLIKSGHSKIGFIKGHTQHGAALKRYNGYVRSLKSANIAFEKDYVVQGDFSFASGVIAARKLLRLQDRPTAIFAANDYMAAGVVRIANELGISVPDELAVVGFDDAPVSRQIWPSLSTVKQPVSQMAEAAANLLIAKIKDPALKPEHQIYKAELLIREST